MIIAGGQWGDEGKGKVVAYLALTDKPKIIVERASGLTQATQFTIMARPSA